MIYPDKTITDNAFVDNVLYYSKLMAMNSTIKNEEEALLNETKESLRNRDLLISSIEGNASYNLYENFPEEILKKYIKPRSNIDIYAENYDIFMIHLDSYNGNDKFMIYSQISVMANTIYRNHYDIMYNYLDSIGETWISDKQELYNKCKNYTANYIDLFYELPEKTRYRILKTYINNYDDSNIEDLSKDLDVFINYISSRSDTSIEEEVQRINEAMRNTFASHYNIMIERGYLKNNDTNWIDFISDNKVYDKCKNNTVKYTDLYDLFPKNELKKSLELIFGERIVYNYNLYDNINILNDYLNNYDNNSDFHISELTKELSDKYIRNYNKYLDKDIYDHCFEENRYRYDIMHKYLPLETKKMIMASNIKEISNIKVYSQNKNMLNSYLATLSKEESEYIKSSIVKDMHEWYPKHYVETNNYYRALIGKPPLDKNGNVMQDTLISSWNDDTKQYVYFGDKFISRVSSDIYPEIHWKQQLCDFDAYDIEILNQYGILDDWVAACGKDANDPRYKYLKYLGDNSLDIYTCSKAMNFQLIGVPTIDDSEFKRKFINKYAINRDYVIRCVYSDAYKFQSDYYNNFMIIFILINTIIDCLDDIPEYIINREVFDSRCIKYLFESFGIPYYSEIPIKYQKAMLKNLNILIKYKSSTKNMIDICSLFGFSDVRVFEYYLFKQRCVDTNTGEYIFDENNDISYDLNKLYIKDKTGTVKDYNGIRYTKLLDYRYYDQDKYTKTINYEDENGEIQSKKIINNNAEVFIMDTESDEFIPLKDVEYFHKIKAETIPSELKFIKVPINDNFIDYKNDSDYIIPYNEIVLQDEGNTWDGGEDHDKLYSDLLDYEFNAVKSKYISVETVTEMTELSFQVSYFYNMLFDNLYSEDALTVEIPYIKIGHKFRFMDIVCYLFSLMYLYNGLEDNIMYSPTQILYVKGYNFNSDLNEVIKDATAFQQNNPITGEPYKDYEKYNIFDINERINNDNYDYQKAFNEYKIKGFNLDCDVDELEKWLNDNYRMSLDDFIVDDTLSKFPQIITLRNFFSLRNSYYQKNIFKNNLSPLPYNQDIKYAFNYTTYKKNIITDINNNMHNYVHEDDYYIELFNDDLDVLYIMNNISYINTSNYKLGRYAIYYKYIKQNDGSYIKNNNIIYFKEDEEYKELYNGNIAIMDAGGNYIFATNEYYKKINNEYELISDPKYFREDNVYLKTLKFAEFYICVDGNWMLDPNNCYIKITQNGSTFYVLASEAGDYSNNIISEDNCYILHSDGHFIRLIDTDYYRKKQSGEEYNGYEYLEEDCFVITDEITEYYDVTADPIVYYKKLSDYYLENNYIIYNNDYYVKDINGDYIHQSQLIDPNNCYYNDNGNMTLVIDHIGKIVRYNNPKNVNYLLIRHNDNDYYKYKFIDGDYLIYNDDNRRYMVNSDDDYITIFYKNFTYDETKNIIIVLNKELDGNEEYEESEKYDPEKTDGVWDENDWYYSDDYAGEHMWYYKIPGVEIVPEEEYAKKSIGSGFYFDASSYLGDVELDYNSKYYMAFDIETNFIGNIQISCDADDSIIDAKSNIYNVIKGNKQHISQIFTTNNINRPRLKFLIYNYNENPIKAGNYVVISNIRFVKAYNNNYIAQDIPSYDRLQELYRTNEAIYKYLITLMANTDSIHMYNIYKKLYDSLMISKYNKEAFKIGENSYAKTYTDFIETRDAVLYERLCYFKSLDPDTMHKQIADNIVEVTYAIDDCIDTYSYGYLYSYFPAVSATYIQQYIIKIINFFKSWKVHLLGINTVYKFDDALDNKVKILECHKYKNRMDSIKSNMYIYGNVKINPMDDINISGERYTDLYPDLVSITNKYNDNCIIRDRVRIISNIDNRLDYFYDTDGELNIITNEEIKISEIDNNISITSSNSGFRVIDDNILEITSNDNELPFDFNNIDKDKHNIKDLIDKR